MDVEITSWFNNVQNRLPIILPSMSSQQNQEGEITAKVFSMTTAEMILNIRNKLETNIVVDKDICTVDDTVLHGFYRCRKRAKAQVLCKSSRPIQAEIECPTATFSIPCDNDGQRSVLQFSFSHATIDEKCTVTCGSTPTTFAIRGLLKFTSAANSMIDRWLKEKANTEFELQWPDFKHIAHIFMNYYKTLIAVFILLNTISLLTYACLPTCTIQLALCIFKAIKLFLRNTGRLICLIRLIPCEKSTPTHTKLP